MAPGYLQHLLPAKLRQKRGRHKYPAAEKIAQALVCDGSYSGRLLDWVAARFAFSLAAVQMTAKPSERKTLTFS